MIVKHTWCWRHTLATCRDTSINLTRIVQLIIRNVIYYRRFWIYRHMQQRRNNGTFKIGQNTFLWKQLRSTGSVFIILMTHKLWLMGDELKYSGQESGQEIRSPGPMVYNGKATTRHSPPIRMFGFEWPIRARLRPLYGFSFTGFSS